MPDLTSIASTLRAERYQYRAFASALPYTVVLEGTLSATPTFPTLTSAYTLTSGDHADVKTDQLVVFYDSAGVRKGSLRVAQGTVTATSLPIAETAAGTVNLTSGDTFKVFDAYELRDKVVSATAALLKDSRIAVSDNTSNQPPVANAGGLWAGFVDDGQSYATVTFDASASFTVDPDSAGTLTYVWAVGDGTITVGSTTTAAITVQFPAGFRHVTLTVTDSGNGKSTTRRVPVWVHEHTGANAPLSIQIERLYYGLERGANGRFQLPKVNQSSLDNLPDGALIVIWEVEHYGNTQASYGSNVANRSHIKAAVYLVRDSIHIEADTNTVTFEAVSPLQILEQTPALPQLLLRDSTPSTWQEVKGLTVNRVLEYLARWHSSAFTYFDFVWLGGTDHAYARIAVETTESIAAQLRDVAGSVRAKVTCDWLGRLLIVRDPNYLSSSDRSSITTTYNLTSADRMSTDFDDNHRGQTKFVRGEGITAGTTVAAQKPVFSNAPGNAPAWLGTGTDTISKQIVADQAALNTVTGMHFAALSGLYNGRFVPQAARITLPDGYHVFDPALMEWITLTVTASSNKRGVAFDTSTRWLIRSVEVAHDAEAGTKDITLEVSHETIGVAGVSYTPPKANALPGFTFPDLFFPIGDFAPLTGADLKSGTGNIALFVTDGIAITSTFSAIEPTWTWYSLASLSITGTLQDFTVDAFSPLYLGTGTAVNGWLVTSTNIYRITDIFGSIAAASQYTFPNALPANGSRAIQTERGQQNFVVCASYYATGPSAGVRVTQTTDGVNWAAETLLTANVDTSGAFLIPAVYVSGKLANTAYTAAITGASGTTPAFGGYKTTNGGTSWASFSNPDVSGFGLPGCLHVPWNQASDTIMYYGSVNGSPSPADRVYRANGATKTDITPQDASGNFYTVRFNHGIHSCDSNRMLMVCCATDRVDASTVNRGVWVSRNGGDDWTLIYGPVSAFGSDPQYLAASVSGDGNGIYFWGGPAAIAFSPDFGVTIQDKAGDLADYTSGSVRNICGG